MFFKFVASKPSNVGQGRAGRTLGMKWEHNLYGKILEMGGKTNLSMTYDSIFTRNKCNVFFPP